METKKGEEDAGHNDYELKFFAFIRVIRAIRGSFFSSVRGEGGAWSQGKCSENGVCCGGSCWP